MASDGERCDSSTQVIVRYFRIISIVKTPSMCYSNNRSQYNFLRYNRSSLSLEAPFEGGLIKITTPPRKRILSTAFLCSSKNVQVPRCWWGTILACPINLLRAPNCRCRSSGLFKNMSVNFDYRSNVSMEILSVRLAAPRGRYGGQANSERYAANPNRLFQEISIWSLGEIYRCASRLRWCFVSEIRQPITCGFFCAYRIGEKKICSATSIITFPLKRSSAARSIKMGLGDVPPNASWTGVLGCNFLPPGNVYVKPAARTTDEIVASSGDRYIFGALTLITF